MNDGEFLLSPHLNNFRLYYALLFQINTFYLNILFQSLWKLPRLVTHMFCLEVIVELCLKILLLFPVSCQMVPCKHLGVVAILCSKYNYLIQGNLSVPKILEPLPGTTVNSNVCICSLCYTVTEHDPNFWIFPLFIHEYVCILAGRSVRTQFL